jgi:hypothetical protein
MAADKVKELEQENILFIKEMAFNLESVSNKAMKARSLCDTLFTAFYYQNTFSITNFEWAFILLEDLTVYVQEELKELTAKTFEHIKEDKIQT